MLQMYFREPYHVTDKIIITQPTIGDIVKFGEKRIYQAIAPFTCNPTSYRLQLWDMGIDWNEISDYELFIMLAKGIKKEDISLLFANDFDFQNFQVSPKEEQIILYDKEHDIEINEIIYYQIAEYIRTMFNQHPKVEKAKNKYTKEDLIEEDRIKLATEIENQKKQKTHKSVLLPLISAMVNHAGFKYKTTELKEVGIVEFMDSVQRLQIYESTRALMSGIYSGMVDTKSMDLKKELNWLRDLN